MMKLLAIFFALFSLCTYAKTFSLMTYNAENLFDTTHDKGKEDWTYLPLSFKKGNRKVQEFCESLTNDRYRKECFEFDWSDQILKKKIQNLARVIRSYNNGRGPDIIVFQEIENENVLRLLVRDGLQQMGYRYGSAIEGPDVRGIDVGVLSRYPIVGKQYYEIDLFPYSTRPTRGIQKTLIKIGDKTVSILANHWPSQGNAPETRVKASQVLKEIAERSRTEIVIAAGDFNTKPDDYPHGIKRNILPIFENVETKGRKASGEKAPGSHWYYKSGWTSLDKIFVLKDSLKHVKVKYESFDIVAFPEMLRDLRWVDRDTGEEILTKNIPYRFNAKTGEGFSDHLPVAIKFEL